MRALAEQTTPFNKYGFSARKLQDTNEGLCFMPCSFVMLKNYCRWYIRQL